MIPLGLYEYYEQDYEGDEDGGYVAGASTKRLLLYEDKSGTRRYFYRSSGYWMDDNSWSNAESGRWEFRFRSCGAGEITVRFIPEASWSDSRDIDSAEEHTEAPERPYRLKFCIVDNKPQILLPPGYLIEETALLFLGASDSKEFSSASQIAESYLRKKDDKVSG